VRFGTTSDEKFVSSRGLPIDVEKGLRGRPKRAPSLERISAQKYAKLQLLARYI